MLFSFKQKSQDFIVEEELPFQLSWKWDALFVYFEKRNLSTMDIIKFLCKQLNISRLTLWFAWLKDKDAITRQRVSIYKSALNKIWWENNFLNTLSQKTRIIKTSRHHQPIGMTTHINNTFHIRLRANKNLSQIEIKNIQTLIPKLFKTWFPNSFGKQRFWIDSKNRQIGKDILDSKIILKEKFESKFKLQSYASRLFNQYLDIRTKWGISLLDWDIVNIQPNTLWYFDQTQNSIKIIQNNKFNKDYFYYPNQIKEEIKNQSDLQLNITWPIIWNNLLCPLVETQSWKLEKSFLESNNINSKAIKIFSDNKIFWLRRNLWTRPHKSKYRRDWQDLLIDFTLDSGVYASVFIDILLKSLSKIKNSQ